MKGKKDRILIVGAGMSGLVAAAYLARAGYDVLVLEKNKESGGLVNSFEKEGFIFDAGPRSILNAGIIKPMLEELGIELTLLESPVSIGIEKEVINITQQDGLREYKRLLETLYPENLSDVDMIMSTVKDIVKDMAILYGIDNPFFKDLKHDKEYLVKVLLPWLYKFLFMLSRMNRTNEPVEAFLGKICSNQALIDIIAQHFFKKTPTFFALGYFYAYMDYKYPKGGTGQLPRAIIRKIGELGATIQNETEITEVIPSNKMVVDARGKSYVYDHLIWCADLKKLYKITRMDGLGKKLSSKLLRQKEVFLSKRGSDSVFSMFIGVDEPLETFRRISKGHFFFTPSRKGLGDVHRSKLVTMLGKFGETSKTEVLSWLDQYCQLTTYEISIPALRDPSLAPAGKTGMVISMLFEYDLMKKVDEAGWYKEFRAEIEERMLDTLSRTVYQGLRRKVLFKMSATPLSIEKVAGSSEGAIVGWSYETGLPVASKLLQMAAAVRSPIPNVLHAGQWVYSPAGMPTAIFTGWYAAKRVMKVSKNR